MNIEFDSEPVYGDNDKCVKTKIKIYGDRVNTMPKENTSYKCLSLKNTIQKHFWKSADNKKESNEVLY